MYGITGDSGLWLHLTMHRTIGLTNYYRTISGELMD